MKLNLLVIRLKKLAYILLNLNLLKTFLKFRVLATFQHSQVLKNKYRTIVDIGANRGQFSLAASQNPDALIYAFEPLSKPAEIFKKVFKNNNNVKFFNVAIGNTEKETSINVSAKDDSSSLLEISQLQNELFPGTFKDSVEEVFLAPLEKFINEDDLISPALLKLDVQGYELEALKGCQKLLKGFDHIYCECSFISLYKGQKLSSEIISFLNDHDFELAGFFNLKKTPDGDCIQADLLFASRLK